MSRERCLGARTALILAAGLGTRLGPLTAEHPKAMVPVAGQPMLYHTLLRLAHLGIQQVVINTHYRPESIRTLLHSRNWGFACQESYEPEILGTGGAIAAAAGLLQKAMAVLNECHFWIVNCDVLTSLDPAKDLAGLTARVATDPRASMLILRPDHDAERFGAFEIEAEGRLVRMLSARQGTGSGPYMFTGLHLLGDDVFQWVQPRFGSVFDQYYLPAFAAGRPLFGALWNGAWFDTGTPAQLAAAEAWLKQHELRQQC